MAKADSYTEVNRKYEALFMPRIKRTLDATVKSVIARLRDGGVSSATKYLNENLGNEKLATEVRLLYGIVGSRHARITYSRLLKDRQTKAFGFNEVWTAYIQQYLERFLLEKITFEVSDTTRRHVLRIIQQGFESGASIDQMVDKLQGWPGTRYQAARIVRTEVNRAANVGHKAQEQTSEYQQTKTWRSVHDFRTRGNKPKDHASHVLLDTVTLDADDKFTDVRNGDRLDFPGDPTASAASTVNCRCRVVMKFKRDANGDLIPKRRSTLVIRPEDNKPPVIIRPRSRRSGVRVQLPGSIPNRQIITI